MEKQAIIPALIGAGLAAYGLYSAGKRMVGGIQQMADGHWGEGAKQMAYGVGEGALSLVPGGTLLKGVGGAAKMVGAGSAVNAASKLPGAIKTVGSVAAPAAAFSMIPGNPADEAGTAAGAGQEIGNAGAGPIPMPPMQQPPMAAAGAGGQSGVSPYAYGQVQ